MSADLPIIFLSSFPRSGSTMCAALMSQNPRLFVTATNDISSLLMTVRNQWHGLEAFKAQGINTALPRITRMLRSMLSGFFAPEFAEGRTVIDKDRAWLAHIELLEAILERRVRFIVTIRDLRDVCASLERLHRQHPLTKKTMNAEQVINGQTCEQRCRQYLGNDAMLGLFLNRWRNALESGYGDRLIVVPYAQLIANPVGIVGRIHSDLHLGSFTCDPTAVKQAQPEDDQERGLPYHVLRPQVDQSAANRWQGVLPPDVAAWLNESYPIVQQFAAGPYRNGI